MNMQTSFNFNNNEKCNKGRKTNTNAILVNKPLVTPIEKSKVKQSKSAGSSSLKWKNTPNNVTYYNSVTINTGSSSKTRSTSDDDQRVIIAISEGRGQAACEVGIAAIDVTRSCLILSQISDTPSYINTFTKVNILEPTEIIIPMTFVETATSNRLTNKIKEQFKNVQITAFARSTFNKSNGMDYIKRLCAKEWDAVILFLQHKYYALAAASAVVAYVERILCIHFAPHSLKVEYQECKGFTLIDVATADRLELVASTRPNLKKRYSCLLDVLNHCSTKIGQRILRASILQPLSAEIDIENRLDCVTALMQSPNTMNSLPGILASLYNLDQLLTISTVLSEQYQNCSERQLNYLLLLNVLLEQLTPLRDIFEDFPQSLFKDFSSTLKNENFDEIKQILRTILSENARPGKGQAGDFQRCFAIKPGVNGLLDCMRKIYSEKLDELREYVKQLGEKYSLNIFLHSNNKKGYHIVMKLNQQQKRSFKTSSIPAEFIQIDKLASGYTMKTVELITLSNNVQEILTEILTVSNIMIRKTLEEIQTHIGLFYKLCEQVAMIDMLQSLAKASLMGNHGYVRPKFSDYMELEYCRHPLLDYLLSTEPIANSMFATPEYNMHIITGPNGSGKSIFIRQLVLIQIMAQVGCYVPAKKAVLKACDRILARIYFEDNLDFHASAFVLEMKELQYFLTVATPKTLIIVDELCRSTCIEEGTAIAMAICEKLMKTSSFIFFTTHFKQLTSLGQLYFNVKLWQMETIINSGKDQKPKLQFTHNLISGSNSIRNYGFALAKKCWPENVIKFAENFLLQLRTSQQRPSIVVERNEKFRLKYDLEAELKQLKRIGKLTGEVLEEKLQRYQQDLQNFGFDFEENVTVENVRCDPDLEFYQNRSENQSFRLEPTENEFVFDNDIFEKYPATPFNHHYQQENSNLNLTTGGEGLFTYNQSFANQSYNENFENSFVLNKQSPIIFNFDNQNSIDSTSTDMTQFALPLIQDRGLTSTPILTEIPPKTNQNPADFFKKPSSQQSFMIRERNTSINSMENLNRSISSIKGQEKTIENHRENLGLTSTPIFTEILPKINQNPVDLFKKPSSQQSFLIRERNSSINSMENLNRSSSSERKSKSNSDSIKWQEKTIENRNDSSRSDKKSKSDSSTIQWREKAIENEKNSKTIESNEERSNQANKYSILIENESHYTEAENTSLREDLESFVESLSRDCDLEKSSSSIEEIDESDENIIDESIRSAISDDRMEIIDNEQELNQNLSQQINNQVINDNIEQFENNEEVTNKAQENNQPQMDVDNEDENFENSNNDKGLQCVSIRSSIINDNIERFENEEEVITDKLQENNEPQMDVDNETENSKNDKGLRRDAIQSPIITSNSSISSENEFKKKKVEVKKITAKRRNTPYKKFVPPKPLSKKEIKKMFLEQDMKFLETNDYEGLAENIRNRPTIEQVQQIEHLAVLQKTNAGLVVLPVENRERRRKRKFLAPLKKSVAEPFDVTLFSDKNSKKFEALMHQSKNCSFGQEEITDKDQEAVAGPSGYYSQNRMQIDNMVDKYLKSVTETSNSSIFSQAAEKIDYDDVLNLS